MNSLLGFLLYFFFVGVVYTSQTQNGSYLILILFIYLYPFKSVSLVRCFTIDELFYLSSSTFLLPGESPVDFPAPLVALTPANPGSSRFFISDISSQHGSRIHKLDLSSSSSSADNTHGKLTPIQTLQGKDLQLGMIRSMGFDADRSLLFVADTATKTLMKIKLDSPHQMVAEVMETIVSFNETGKPLSIAYHRCSK